MKVKDVIDALQNEDPNREIMVSIETPRQELWSTLPTHLPIDFVSTIGHTEDVDFPVLINITLE